MMNIFNSTSKSDMESLAQTIRNAGGSIVGRTRLQKTLYILKIAGFNIPFDFEYKHYGPFSDQAAETAVIAAAFGQINEDTRQANWGGSYSLYSAQGSEESDPSKIKLTKITASADAIALELAATAAYLFHHGYPSEPWEETCRRKPDKVVGGKLALAKAVYEQLRSVTTPVSLPKLP